jgi:hypothetical protein
LVSKIPKDKLVGGRLPELMDFYVRTPNPVSFDFQLVDQMAGDETAGSTNENAFLHHMCTLFFARLESLKQTRML